MKKILLSMLVFATASASANELTDNLTTTAKIENFCSISANDLNFGVVNLPLTAQSANSTMNVLCNNNTSYTIDLAYGGIYGSGSINGGKNYKLTFMGTGSAGSSYNIEENNKYIGYISCYDNNNVGFSSVAIANLYGYSTKDRQPDPNDACSPTYSHMPSKVSFTIGQPYDYGVMNGSFKNDKLAYSISLPDDSSKVWNAGNYSYSSKGIGSNQEIAINASLIPDKSSSKYIAQDTYLDTVTATISY